MNIQLNISEEKKLLFIAITGKGSLSQIQSMMNHIWSKDEYSPDFGFYMDLREFQLRPNSKDLKELSSILVKSDKRIRGHGVVVVNSPILTAAASFLYKISTSNKNQLCFSSQENALKELGLQKNYLSQLKFDEITL